MHAHTGHFGGVVAAELARPGRASVVTEHATFLRKVFGSRPRVSSTPRCWTAPTQPALRQPQPARADRHRVPASTRDKLRIVPNPIDFDRFAVRPSLARVAGALALRRPDAGAQGRGDPGRRVRPDRRRGPERDAHAGRRRQGSRTTSAHRIARARPGRAGGPASAGGAGRDGRADARPRRPGARQPGGDVRHDHRRGGRHRHAGAGRPERRAGRDAQRPGRRGGHAVPGDQGSGGPRGRVPAAARAVADPGSRRGPRGDAGAVRVCAGRRAGAGRVPAGARGAGSGAAVAPVEAAGEPAGRILVVAILPPGETRIRRFMQTGPGPWIRDRPDRRRPGEVGLRSRDGHPGAPGSARCRRSTRAPGRPGCPARRCRPRCGGPCRSRART